MIKGKGDSIQIVFDYPLFAAYYKMDVQSKAMNTQTCMIVWDVHLKFARKVNKIRIFSPLFSLNPSNEKESKNWIRLERAEDKLQIDSNLSTITEFKGCTTYMINSSTNKVVEIFEGIKEFPWNHTEWSWSEKMRFVFELKMECVASADSTIVWQYCTTKTKPTINTTGILLNLLNSDVATHTVLNDQAVSCSVKRYILNNYLDNIHVKPIEDTGNWNLLTVMLNQPKNNVLEWEYQHTTDSFTNGRNFPTSNAVIVIEVKELSTSIENMADFDIAAVKSLIVPQMSPTNDTKILASPILVEYFETNKFCDAIVQIKDQKIRAHKVVLATASPMWHDLFNEDETLATILIDDFDYGTIKELIEYMYTGVMKQATDQLLIAADKYGVVGLKELCELQLIETIDMKTVVKLLVLADHYKADKLFNSVLLYVQGNYAAFKELEEAKSIFMMYPELGFKLFARIM